MDPKDLENRFNQLEQAERARFLAFFLKAENVQFRGGSVRWTDCNGNAHISALDRVLSVCAWIIHDRPEDFFEDPSD